MVYLPTPTTATTARLDSLLPLLLLILRSLDFHRLGRLDLLHHIPENLGTPRSHQGISLFIGNVVIARNNSSTRPSRKREQLDPLHVSPHDESDGAGLGVTAAGDHDLDPLVGHDDVVADGLCVRSLIEQGRTGVVVDGLAGVEGF